MKRFLSVLSHLFCFILLSVLTPFFFKQFPFLTLPCLGIAVVLTLKRDFEGEAPALQD